MNIDTLVKGYCESIYFLSKNRKLMQKESIVKKVEKAKAALDDLMYKMDATLLLKYVSANELLESLSKIK